MSGMVRLAALIAVIGVLLLPAHVAAGGPAPGGGTSGSFVAVSVRGSIVLYFPSGAGQTILTRSGRDYAPVVAPNGRAIAFWRGSPFSQANHTFSRVMLARQDVAGNWHVAPFSSQSQSAYQQSRTIAWSPDSQALAWIDNETVQYRHLGGPQRTVLQVGLERDISAGLAFSRDGTTVAASLAPTGSGLPRTLRVAVRRLSAPQQRVITITFRPGVLTAPGMRGSVPVGDSLAYTTSQLAPPGHTLQVHTGIAGAGLQMTGIFLVPDTGGQARLVQGNGHGLHGIPPFGYGMDGATHFQDAPNGRYLATDPTGGFYVAGEIGPLHVSAPIPFGCVMSQWTWLADSAHIAYVTMCTVPGSSPIRFRQTVSTVSMYGGPPRVLYRTVASRPDAIDLAPQYRCVACG